MGDLNIRVIEAKNLIPADKNGKSDPFVTVEIVEDPLQTKQKTKVHHKTLNPIWNQAFNFRAPTPNSNILFKVWDHDTFKRNDPLGNVQVQVNRLIPNSPNNLWFDLQGVPSGQIHIEVTFTPFAQPSPRGQQPVNFNPATFIPQPGPFQAPYQAPQQPQSGYQQQPQYPPPPAQYGYAPQQQYPPPQGYPQNRQAPPPVPARPAADIYTPSVSSEPMPLANTTSQPNPGAGGVAGISLQKSVSQGSNVAGIGSIPPPSQVAYPPNPNLPPPPPPRQADIYAPIQSASANTYTPLPPPPIVAPLPPPPVGYPMQAGGPIVGLTQGMQNVSLAPNTGLVAGPPIAKFFVDIKKRAPRDYILIMDMSGSMAGHRWKSAKEATMKIAPFACQADPDGITLYLFSSSYKRFPNLTSAAQVQSIFEREHPSGTTDLTGVLQAAFCEHFKGRKPTTILVITDGEPNDRHSAKKAIIHATQKMNSDNDLSVSFIQIGGEHQATHFLKDLDDGLTRHGAKFDIVDTVPATALGSMTFDELIHRSIYD